MLRIYYTHKSKAHEKKGQEFTKAEKDFMAKLTKELGLKKDEVYRSTSSGEFVGFAPENLPVPPKGVSAKDYHAKLIRLDSKLKKSRGIELYVANTKFKEGKALQKLIDELNKEALTHTTLCKKYAEDIAMAEYNGKNKKSKWPEIFYHDSEWGKIQAAIVEDTLFVSTPLSGKKNDYPPHPEWTEISEVQWYKLNEELVKKAKEKKAKKNK